MGTNLELGYHHGECCLYSNAEVSFTENPKQLQLQKKKKKKSVELEMLTWDLGEQGSSLSSVR